MDPMDRIDEIISVVEAARNVPMSRNCMIDRAEMIGLLEQLRVELPGDMRRAAALLDERDKMHALREIGTFQSDERDHNLPF